MHPTQIKNWLMQSKIQNMNSLNKFWPKIHYLLFLWTWGIFIEIEHWFIGQLQIMIWRCWTFCLSLKRMLTKLI